MSHVTARRIHVFKNRGIDLRISVTTSETTSDFSNITFVAGSITKTGLTASDTSSGFDVDFTLSASDLNIATGRHDWELKATLAGEVRTVGHGDLVVDAEPTS